MQTWGKVLLDSEANVLLRYLHPLFPSSACLHVVCAGDDMPRLVLKTAGKHGAPPSYPGMEPWVQNGSYHARACEIILQYAIPLRWLGISCHRISNQSLPCYNYHLVAVIWSKIAVIWSKMPLFGSDRKNHHFVMLLNLVHSNSNQTQ